MATYQVLLGPVEHDGILYEDGASIELAVEEAALLLAQNVLGEQEHKRSRKTEGD